VPELCASGEERPEEWRRVSGAAPQLAHSFLELTSAWVGTWEVCTGLGTGGAQLNCQGAD